jgi:hypothetical protein
VSPDFHSNEGTFLWKLGWKLTTGLEFRLSYGLDYGLLMAHEHVNTAYEIDRILRHFYEKVECSCFGINKSIAFYRFYLCTGTNEGKGLRIFEERIISEQSGLNQLVFMPVEILMIKVDYQAFLRYLRGSKKQISCILLLK